MLADDVEIRFRQQVVDIRHAARDGILDRDHREIGRAIPKGREGILEGGAGQSLPAGIDLGQAISEFAPRSPWKAMTFFILNSFSARR